MTESTTALGPLLADYHAGTRPESSVGTLQFRKFNDGQSRYAVPCGNVPLSPGRVKSTYYRKANSSTASP